jgi:hypothetical protein
MAENYLADYCWVIVGSQRRKVITTFGYERIPSQIQKETGISFCNVSRVLHDMVDRGLVECIELEERHRLYRLTGRGTQVTNKIQALFK